MSSNILNLRRRNACTRVSNFSQISPPDASVSSSSGMSSFHLRSDKRILQAHAPFLRTQIKAPQTIGGLKDKHARGRLSQLR